MPLLMKCISPAGGQLRTGATVFIPCPQTVVHHEPWSFLLRLVACACRVRGERDARQLCEPFEQLILEGRIGGFAGRRLLALVMPVAAADLCLCLFAHSEPALCARTRFKIDRRPGPAHPGPHPAWIDSVRENAWPAPRQREGERNDLQLALGIGPARIPRALRPIDVPERSLSAAMQAAAQEHQTMGTFHQRREDIRRERVDRERGGVAFRRRAALLYGVDAR